MRKGGTREGREENERWKRKKCVELQLPENILLQNYQRQTTDSPQIHSLLLPNIVHDSNNLQCQHILTKV